MRKTHLVFIHSHLDLRLKDDGGYDDWDVLAAYILLVILSSSAVTRQLTPFDGRTLKQSVHFCTMMI